MNITHFPLAHDTFYSPMNINTYGTIATINRIARNAVYIGKRSSTFHEPDPSNPLLAGVVDLLSAAESVLAAMSTTPASLIRMYR